MKTKLAGLLAAFLCASVALVAQDVTYNFDQAANFSQFKTYKWVEIKDRASADQLVDKQIRTSIETQLSTKGLSKSAGDTADLYIAYQVGVNQEKEINSYTTGGAGWGYGARWGGMGGMTTSTTSTINIGTLVLDMYEPAGKTLVWRGKATKTLDPNAKPDKRQKNLDKAMAKLLKNYPPPVKK